MGVYGAEMFKTLLLPQITNTSYQTSPANVWLNILRNVTVSDFWNIAHFKYYEVLNFNMGVNGKSLKSRTCEAADHRGKWIKIWDSGVLRTTSTWYFSCQVIWLQIRSPWKISDVKTFNMLQCTCPTNLFWMSWKIHLKLCINSPHKVTFSDFWNIGVFKYYETLKF